MTKSKFVLVVEDEDEIRSLIVATLKEQATDLDLLIVEAKDGREAIAFAARQEFHCIVTDLNMPRASGEDLIRSLLSAPMNANTPTVVVSGNLSDGFLEQFKNVRIIEKPFVPDNLAQTVSREIKLGRTDDRVPIHLLNPVLDSLQKMMTDQNGVSKNPCELKPPTVKKSGQKLEGDFYAALTLTTGLTQAKLGFVFRRPWLNWLKHEYFSRRNDQWASMSLELTARHAALAVIEKSQTTLAAMMGAVPRIAELSVVDLEDEVKAAEAAKSSGILVALHTDQGQVLATAVTPLKAKRLAA